MLLDPLCIPCHKNNFKHVSKWSEAIDIIQDPRIENRFVDKAKTLRNYLLATAKNEYLCRGEFK